MSTGDNLWISHIQMYRFSQQDECKSYIEQRFMHQAVTANNFGVSQSKTRACTSSQSEYFAYNPALPGPPWGTTLWPNQSIGDMPRQARIKSGSSRRYSWFHSTIKDFAKRDT